MPTYQYRCSNCGHEVELIQKIADRRPPICVSNQACVGHEMNLVIAPTTFILKGSCWAKDGYKK